MKLRKVAAWQLIAGEQQTLIAIENGLDTSAQILDHFERIGLGTAVGALTLLRLLGTKQIDYNNEPSTDPEGMGSQRFKLLDKAAIAVPEQRPVIDLVAAEQQTTAVVSR